MSIFDVFKSRWSAVKMTEVDRQKIFWYLQRKTSYTAWKREVEIFDRFVEVFEKQIREQPHAPGLMDGTDWPIFRTEVLKAQVLYEQSMERFLTGDRTIFLYNSRGSMVDATTLSESWYTELVNHGMRGDHSYDGKYVPLLTALMHDFFDAVQLRGYLQPMISGTPAPELWSTFWYDKYVELLIPDDLPDVPAPTTTVIRTGQEVPVFGIYEPQIKDGCMNYLLAGTEAPKIWESDGTYATDNLLSVTWRLIWEDTRYIDGVVPAEEKFYFQPPKRFVEPPLASNYVDDSLSALTGEICVRSGVWAVLGELDGRITIVKDSRFPTYKGNETIWIFVQQE